MGKKRKEEDVDDIKTVIKAFTRGTEGLTVATNKAGQYVVQVGTYDLIPMSTGGGGSYMGGFEMTQAPRGSTAYANGIQMMTYNPDMYYVPGRSSYMSTSARYYKTIYFKVLLDSSSLKPVRGRVASSIGEQIKDFMDDSDQKAKVAKQFAIGGKQYYGFYDRDQLAYVIQEIMIRK
jgi:hypothetical protein